MTADAELQQLRFVPSRVEGVVGVTEAVVLPDRLRLRSKSTWRDYDFWEIAAWPWPKVLHRFLARLGKRRRWLCVADRDWFHPPADRYFRFYTTPPVTLFMPVDEPVDYEASFFLRVQNVIRSGGFDTADLG